MSGSKFAVEAIERSDTAHITFQKVSISEAKLEPALVCPPPVMSHPLASPELLQLPGCSFVASQTLFLSLQVVSGALPGKLLCDIVSSLDFANSSLTSKVRWANTHTNRPIGIEEDAGTVKCNHT